MIPTTTIARPPMNLKPSRAVKAKVESVDNIVKDGTLSIKMPWVVNNGARKWAENHPQKLGKTDTLTLQMLGGRDSQIEILRNGRSEFYAKGTQGAHDVDHVYFESAWEQMGGRPVTAASPVNEILVNAFEWVLTPQWRDGRVKEMNKLRERDGLPPHDGLPSDEEFLSFQMQAGRDGARQLVHQTVTGHDLANSIFRLAGRRPENFPNETELDWSMRAVTGTTKSLDEVLGELKKISRNAIQVARAFGAQQSDFARTVNEVRTSIHKLVEQDEASAVISSEKLELSPELLDVTGPLIQDANKRIAALPAVYRHGINGELEESSPEIPLYLV